MTKRMAIASAILMAMGAATAQARADEGEKHTAEDVAGQYEARSFNGCVEMGQEVLKSGVSPDTVVSVRDRQYNTLSGKQPLSAVIAACKEGLRDRLIQGLPGYARDAEQYAAQAVEDHTMLQNAETYLGHCRTVPADAIALGADPATPVAYKGKSYRLDGFFASACAAADQAIKDVRQDQIKPFIGVLKADKLRLIAESPDDGYIVPKVGFTADPKTLATSKLWFETYSREPGDYDRCSIEMHGYRRYQFDAKHKLVKESEKWFCGEIPSGSLR